MFKLGTYKDKDSKEMSEWMIKHNGIIYEERPSLFRKKPKGVRIVYKEGVKKK